MLTTDLAHAAHDEGMQGALTNYNTTDSTMGSTMD
jgi:hypothetical protein